MNEGVTKTRDLVLAPGQSAQIQDVSKGNIKTYVGPIAATLTQQDNPIIYNGKTGEFRRVDSLAEATVQIPVAVEGFYIELLNPEGSNNKHPEEGVNGSTPNLVIGRKINIHGPVSFALWPGQAASVIRGHSLRSNQYLLARCYNEAEARKHWADAVLKPATTEGESPAAEIKARLEMPKDLTVGTLFIIRGTDVSFYMPPTGISVVREGTTDTGKPRYVREALTLERLEYCILTDENGKKRYEVGPMVVFPQPSEHFVEVKDNDGRLAKKFRAIELNEIQGIHVKVIADYVDDNKVAHHTGEELFITGKDTQIYYPREEHSAIKYDGKTKHFATAVPKGEGKYVMNRLNGEIKTVTGPEGLMLLPDPRTEIIVRRALTDQQCNDMYPNNAEALEYNRGLRAIVGTVPVTRAGAVSEGDYERGTRGRTGGPRGPVAKGIGASYASNVVMESSGVSADQGLPGSEEFIRASSYTAPRSLTLDTRFQGVPQVTLWTGFASLVVSKTGARRVEQGPKTILLDYDESLEAVELSQGKPKSTTNLLRTVYLRVRNNKVSDMLEVETKDHVTVRLTISLLVNFEGDPMKWFEISNYVKYLTDHVRSILKGKAKQTTVAEYYANSTVLIRDALVGIQDANGDRPGMLFEENGMCIEDVDVLGVSILDERIRVQLEKAQLDVVQGNLETEALQRGLQQAKFKEGIAQETALLRFDTVTLQHSLDAKVTQSALSLAMTQVNAELTKAAKKQEVMTEEQKAQNISFDAELDRKRRAKELQLEFDVKEQELQVQLLIAETKALVEKYTAMQTGFGEIIATMNVNESVTKIVEAWSMQGVLGGKTAVDVVQKMFGGGIPLADGISKKLAALANGNGGVQKQV